MRDRLFFYVVGIGLFFLGVGAAGFLPGRAVALDTAATAAVTSGISYQGRLSNNQGAPLDGAYTMRFIVYNAAVAGTALWDSGNVNVTVSKGLFNIKLGVDQSDFDGQPLWVSIIVGGQTLSPRQEITPAPYALSLRPGAQMRDNATAPAGSILSLWPTATGTALYADANGGTGVFGDSENSYGGHFTSNNGTAGLFVSDTGTGLRVQSSGLDHYDHAIHASTVGGYGLYAQSSNNQGVRAEAGNIAGIPVGLGAIGVVGIGQTRGMYAGSGDGIGIYGRSGSSYAGYFYSDGYRGILASSASGYWAGYFTNRGGSTQPGVYVGGTLTVSGAKSGFVVDISQNAGSEPLQPGDVVAVVGVSDPILGDIPTMRVVKATGATAGAVVGVVDQRYIINEGPDGEETVQPDPAAADQRGSQSGIQPGEYVSIVTLGAYRVINVDASYGAIQPGDLLTASPNPGYAMKAVDPAPGTIIGKALETWDNGTGEIAVYVTMQ